MTKPYKCRVEYLESTGTQYIDTGFTPNQNTKSVLDYKITTDLSSGFPLFGSRTSASSKGYSYQRYGSGFMGGQYGSQIAYSNVSPDLNRHIVIRDKNKIYLDGTEIASNNTSTFTCPGNLYLNAMNNNGTAAVQNVGVAYYGMKIYDNDVLVRDFIPVLDNSGRPAMYDQVSGQLFYNQGSGDDFSYGRQIIPVEYLESTGEQYIDCGLTGNQDTSTSITFKNTQVEKQGIVIGSRSSASSNNISTISPAASGGSNYNVVNDFGNYNTTRQIVALQAMTDKVTAYNSKSLRTVYNHETGVTNTVTTTYTGTFTTPTNIYIAYKSAGYASSQYNFVGEIYDCKIWDNGVLVRDFIPCIDENLVPFMFDKVNNTVYLNAGTGEFKVGPYKADNLNKKLLRKKLDLMLATLKKKRKYYCEVEYLEGTGTQYIDTGLDYFADFEVGIQLRTNVSNKALGNGAYYCMQRYNASNPYWYFSTGTGASNSYTSSTRITEHHVMKWKDNKIYADDVLLTEFTKNSNTPNRMYLYSADGGNKYPNVIYFCKLWNPDNGELVRDFIPVLDWDMKPCMYDRITEQLFYNQATSGDDFSYGREIHYVDYLESTGTQYIDMGVGVKSNTEFKATFAIASTSTGRSYFGARNSSNERFQIVNSIGIGGGYFYNADIYPIANKKYEIEMYANGDLYLDGVKINATNGTFSAVAFERNLWLFGTNYYDSSVPLGASTFWKAQVFEGDTLVRDYIPAIDENGVGYMFDRVSHTIYDNAGTGVFKYPAREVEYLESTGTQFIDTGYYPNFNTMVEFMASGISADTFAASSGGTWFTGARQGYLQKMFGSYYNPSNQKLYFGFSTILNNSDYSTANMYGDNKKFVLDKTGLYINDVKIVNNTNTTDFTSPATLALFGLNNNGSIISPTAMKIQYYKILDNDTLVRDFVPSYKDGVLGMWDKANNVFYTNVGTGDGFTTGKIVEPEYE